VCGAADLAAVLNIRRLQSAGSSCAVAFELQEIRNLDPIRVDDAQQQTCRFSTLLGCRRKRLS
jgi:hypothetical protein